MIDLTQNAPISQPTGTSRANTTPAYHDTLIGCSGIPQLDEVLVSNWRPGTIAFVSSHDGCLHTRLCTQITGGMLLRGKRVLYLSALWNISDIIEMVDSGILPWPSNDIGTKPCPADSPCGYITYSISDDPRFENLKSLILPDDVRNGLLDVRNARTLIGSPETGIDEILRHSEVPDLIVLDFLHIGVPVEYLSAPDTKRSDVRAYELGMADRLMRVLADYARRHNVRVLVACHLKAKQSMLVTKRVTAGMVSNYGETVSGYGAVFIGISGLRKGIVEEIAEPDDQIKQYLNVGTPDSELKSVPVSVSRDAHRFDPFDDTDEVDAENRRIQTALRLHSDTEFAGYKILPRKTVSDLLQLAMPECLNVYVLGLLMAHWKEGPKYGRFFCGFQKMGELLGIDRKRVSKAFGILIDKGYFKLTGRKSGRANEVEVVDYRELQDPSIPGYFMIANNLRDEKRRGFLGNSLLLRTWIHLLARAAPSLTVNGHARGDMICSIPQLAEDQGDDLADVKGAVENLVNEGRLTTYEDRDYGFKIYRVTNYEIYQSGKYYKMKELMKAAAKASCN